MSRGVFDLLVRLLAWLLVCLLVCQPTRRARTSAGRAYRCVTAGTDCNRAKSALMSPAARSNSGR